jgi:hypothetical protein
MYPRPDTPPRSLLWSVRLLLTASFLNMVFSGMFIFALNWGSFAKGPIREEVQKEHSSIQDTVNVISKKIDSLGYKLPSRGK